MDIKDLPLLPSFANLWPLIDRWSRAEAGPEADARGIEIETYLGTLFRKYAIDIENGLREKKLSTTLHTDDLAVDSFAATMKAKLTVMRARGMNRWEETSECVLSEALRECVDKGDPVDVANYAMMLHQNKMKIRGSVKKAKPPVAAADPLTHVSWRECLRIGDLPSVDEAMRTFAVDQTEDNATCVIRAVLEAVMTQPPKEDYVDVSVYPHRYKKV